MMMSYQQATSGENTPLLQPSNASGDDAVGSAGSQYYFVPKTDQSGAGELVEEIPEGSHTDEFAPKMLSPVMVSDSWPILLDSSSPALCHVENQAIGFKTFISFIHSFIISLIYLYFFRLSFVFRSIRKMDPLPRKMSSSPTIMLSINPLLLDPTLVDSGPRCLALALCHHLRPSV